MNSEVDLKRTAEHWDRPHFSPEVQRAEWQNHPLALTDGSSAWFTETYLPATGVERGLGTGSTEMEILSSGAVKHFDLWDVSSASLEAVRQHAARSGATDRITTNVGDIHNADLGENRYDPVFLAVGIQGLDLFVGEVDDRSHSDIVS